MAEEPEITLPEEEPRLCPACGTRVAAMATTCLMCGSSLDEEPEESDLEEVEDKRKLPAWARPLIVVAMSAAILAAGLYGFYALMGAQPERTPTVTPTYTPTATLIPSSTPTPRPTLTPTPVPPLAYQVQPGDTLSSIAARYGITVEDILALNPGVQPEALPTGYVLRIPSGTLTPTATPTRDPSLPAPTPGNYVIHIVQQGDTLESIAEQYGVSVSAIREANPDQLPIGSDRIFSGESLVVPLGTPVPTFAPTMDPRATPMPVPLYAASALLSPPDGAVLSGTGSPVMLQWASVSVLGESEWYEVTLLQADGVVSHTFRTRATAWRVPFDFLMEADTDAPEFRWQVQVVREARDRRGELIYREAGLPSETRTFVWIRPTPTPTVSPTPSP
jgi:LysM repeat protein